MQSNSNKSNTTPVKNDSPAWASVGTSAYNKMNNSLATSPMKIASDTFATGGMTPGLKDANNTFSNIMKNGGTNANIDWAVKQLKANAGKSVDTSQLEAIANGMANPGTVSAGNWQSVYDKAGQAGANEQFLTGTARGDMLTNNPYIDKMVSDAQNEAADQTNRLFAAGGRYGSGAHQGTVANETSKIANELRFNNYNAERDRQMNAANAISGEQSSRMGLQGSAASGVAGVEGTNIANKMQADTTRGNIASTVAGIQGGNLDRTNNAASGVGGFGQSQLGNQMNATSNLAGTQNQAFQNVMSMIGALPNIQANKTYDADKQAGIGATIDQMSQSQLDDLMGQISQMDMKDWAKLGGLLSAGTTSAGSWGTQTATQKTPMNILGALGTLFSGINFGSDKQLKKNIKKVGETPGGHDVVKYDVKKGVPAPKRVGILGVIAQDVAKKQPEAVKRMKNGLLAVDYSKLK